MKTIQLISAYGLWLNCTSGFRHFSRNVLYALVRACKSAYRTSKIARVRDHELCSKSHASCQDIPISCYFSASAVQLTRKGRVKCNLEYLWVLLSREQRARDTQKKQFGCVALVKLTYEPYEIEKSRKTTRDLPFCWCTLGKASVD
jgi:hypothetical protein